MDWRELYKQKVISASEAGEKIKNGYRVVIGHAAGEPRAVIDAMVRDSDKFSNIEIVHMIGMGTGEYVKKEKEFNFKHNSLFAGPSTRNAIADGRADFTPCFFSEIPKLFREEYLKVNVAIIQISIPDEHGFCSFGVSNDYTKPAAECADIVIAEINPNMPRTLGDSFIHVRDIDYIVEVNYPLMEMKPSEIGKVEKAIGKNCAELIEDGSTLQLGIGSIPDAVLLFLKDKKDLGIHSEMISDGVLELVESGVINNKKKTLHKDKMVASFFMGTKKFYNFIDNNPMIEMHPVDYVNDPYIIGKNDNMVSINSCIQIDLMGQVAAESMGLKQFSGVGGQVDFVRGANISSGGKSIIAMPSTAAKGTISRIVTFLEEGTAVTTSRNDVHYVVTEYGIAGLKGKSLKERARALINIAHPNFRAQLIKEWEKRFNKQFNYFIYHKIHK
ncbi:acetyl-CoA hydrolase/transferase family protein [Clostridium butanoliproducens]|uniref:acetyl-CoA hydrolase/transferase family protein n=1 Tax=Clostridium butanoliproducens TaxID=2991837 RepID=UPI0024BA2BC9|nr:acetyl-CoA hydrolase/transferase C-terminal domain-containing protein [Clostridium butanoliproducens]MDU1348099.1 acetyl-CoA hydrolase/transferase C-terminal domain-containing protein [Clostridium argentinense]